MIVDGDSVLLYDRENDPGERTDVSQRHPDVVEHLRATLDQHRHRERGRATTAPRDAVPIDPTTQRALEALGYVE
jgi:hypothetical protein